jgi:hypothetical protein
MCTGRIPENLRTKVEEIARRKGLSVSEVHRLALEEYCVREIETPSISRYDDIIGVAEGPAELSSRNKEVFGEILNEKFPTETASKKHAADARGIIPDHPLADVLGTMDSEYMDELRQEIRKYKREVDRRESEQK